MNINNLIPPTASPRPQSRGQSRAFNQPGGYGAASRASMMGGDPALMFKERFTSIQTAKNQIEKQREFDGVKLRLQKEFDMLDLNKDGLVSMEELQEFLDNKLREQKKSPNEQFDP